MKKNAFTLLVTVLAFMALELNASCMGCHGQNYEKKAQGISRVVKDMTSAEIVTALKGYKAGTYGGKMKNMMKSHVARYSDAEIEALAQRIGK